MVNNFNIEKEDYRGAIDFYVKEYLNCGYSLLAGL